MRNWLSRLFMGRHGMDEFSKYMFWSGLLCMALSTLSSGMLANIPSSILNLIGLLQLILAFFRAFSKNLSQREAENAAFLAMKQRRKREQEAMKDRFSQRKDYRFFKCPGCKTWLRVPRGKGKIHINCKCGYSLYRKT